MDKIYQQIKTNLEIIDSQLQGAWSSGRITIVAVTKYASDEQLHAAYQLGLRDFGENYILPAIQRKERISKQYDLKDIRWHLLGPVQSNKVNKLSNNFALIHSIHSLNIATLIDGRVGSGSKQDVLLQINFTGDKNGFNKEELKKNLEKISLLPKLNLLGLMTMGPHEISEKTETIYSQMRHLKEELELGHRGLCHLSMGMSNDYSIAFKHGATILRIGGALFKTAEGS